VPTLETLVQNNVRGTDISTEYLLAIIQKAQPHHSRLTLDHLTRDQLVEHIDALIEWWKKSNPRRASLISGEEVAEIKVFRERVREGSIGSGAERDKKDDTCCCVIS
jgi:hypothetical protein